MLQNTPLVFVVALALSLMLTPVVRKLALKFGLVAVPIARSMHTKPKPFAGLAMYLAFTAAVLVSGAYANEQVRGIVIVGALVALLGLIDDKVAISAKLKLLGQIAGAALLVYGFDLKIESIHSPLGDQWIQFGPLAEPLTILWIVSFMNVVNFIDGLDGLAAGISTIAALTLLLVSNRQSDILAMVLSAALAGSTIGFLRYNFNPAKLFMGDAGSMFLGFTLAAISVQGLMKSAVTVGVLVPVLALALPIFDTAFAIIRRVAAGRSPGEADKDHLHHRLLRLGLSHRNTVLVMWAISAAVALAAVVVTELSVAKALIIVGMVVLAILFGAKKMGLLDISQPEPQRRSIK